MIRHAAEQANISAVIEALPFGYRTRVADLELSGGELQRLAIAQALARHSNLLVLDDVTTSLDPANEREVIKSLLLARAEASVVVVSDRAAVVQHADVVINLDDGRVVPNDLAAVR